MEVAHAAGVELPAELGGDRCGNELTRGRQVVEPLEQLIEPRWNSSAAGLGEPARRRHVRNGQYPRHDLDFDPRRRRVVPEAEEAVGREEELRDRPVRASADLALQILDIERSRR